MVNTHETRAKDVDSEIARIKAKRALSTINFLVGSNPAATNKHTQAVHLVVARRGRTRNPFGLAIFLTFNDCI